MVSVRIIRSKPQICTTRMACTSLEPRPLQMFKVLRGSPQGRGGCLHGGSGDVWSWSLTWMIGQVRQMCILVGSLKAISHINLRRFYGRSGLVAFRGTPCSNQWRGLLKPVFSVIDEWGVVKSAPLACVRRYHRDDSVVVFRYSKKLPNTEEQLILIILIISSFLPQLVPFLESLGSYLFGWTCTSICTWKEIFLLP